MPKMKSHKGAQKRFGSTGVLVMAAIMGAADVDPFILGLTQVTGHGIALSTASLAVLIAAAMIATTSSDASTSPAVAPGGLESVNCEGGTEKVEAHCFWLPEASPRVTVKGWLPAVRVGGSGTEWVSVDTCPGAIKPRAWDWA